MEILLPEAPFNPGTVVELGSQDGRFLRILSKEEALAVADACQRIADGWNVSE